MYGRNLSQVSGRNCLHHQEILSQKLPLVATIVEKINHDVQTLNLSTIERERERERERVGRSYRSRVNETRRRKNKRICNTSRICNISSLILNNNRMGKSFQNLYIATERRIGRKSHNEKNSQDDY